MSPSQQQQDGGAAGAAPDGAAPDKRDVFHKGVAISMWQNSGDEASNWTAFIRSSFPFKALPFGFRRYSGKHSVLESCPDTWNRCANHSACTDAAACMPLFQSTPA